MTSPESDQHETRYSLIHRLKATDDKQAWEDFLTHYQPFIFFLLNKMSIDVDEREDLRQDIMLKLYTKLDNYSQQKGRFRSWLSTVIRHTVLNHIRDNKKEKDNKCELSSGIERVANYELPELESLVQEEWQKYVLDLALERLATIFDDNIIQCFKMTLEQRDVHEIAEELGLTVDSVYTLRSRLKIRLKAEIRRITKDLEF